MSGMVNGLRNLISGPDTSAADEQNRRAREQQSIALDRQRGVEQQRSAEADGQLGRAARQPRGRRLLLAATGDQGLPSTLG